MRASDRPPLGYWSIPAAVALLRMLPRLSLAWTEPPAGKVFLGLSYLPKDFLQYAAFVRQVSVDHSFLLHDPFTTEPQTGRFVLLFHWLLGTLAGLGGIEPLDAFEGSRVPLSFAFFALLWWFLRPFLPDRRDRLTAAVVVGLASGIEAWLRPLAPGLPPELARRALHATSPLHGWSVFASFYNPLWTAALCVALLVLRPLLTGAERARDRILAGAGLFVLFTVHPYAAIGVIAIAAVQPAVRWLSGAPPGARRLVAEGAPLAGAGLAIGALSLWQLGDPVYRATAGGVLGGENLSALWYPVTLGATGVLAALGARRALRAGPPPLRALLGWVAVIAVLHWLPFVNGYKFVYLLPLPVCILAAPVAREILAGARGPGLRPRALAGATCVALFGGALLQTVDDVRMTRVTSATPSELMAVVAALAKLPAANTLVPAGVGNVLPAFSPHRVWLGHWFLTPDYYGRLETFRRLTSDPSAADELRGLVAAQRIRYVVVPAANAKLVARGLGDAVGERERYGSLELFVVR